MSLLIGAAMLGSALIGAYSAKKSGEAIAKGSEKASQTQEKTNQDLINFQKDVFEQQRADSAPWRDIGAQSLQQLQAGIERGDYLPGQFSFNFESDPGYQFRLSEGINALDKSASARGRLLSGAQDRAITRYASNLASQEYGNAFNRAATEYGMESGRRQNQFNQLASLANIGQVANQSDVNARQNMASGVAQSTRAAGNAIAQNAINQGNTRASAYQGYAQAANQGLQNYLLYDMIK